MAATIDAATMAMVNKDMDTARKLVAAGAFDAAAVTTRTALERALFSIAKAKGLWAEACTDRDGTVYKSPKPSRAIYVLGTHKVISKSDRISLQKVNKVGNAGAHAGDSVSRDEVLEALRFMEGFTMGNAAASSRPAAAIPAVPARKRKAMPVAPAAAKQPAARKGYDALAAATHRTPVAATTPARTASACKEAAAPAKKARKASGEGTKAEGGRWFTDISVYACFAIVALFAIFPDWIANVAPGLPPFSIVGQAFFTSLTGDAETGRTISVVLTYFLRLSITSVAVCHLLEKLEGYLTKKFSCS